MTATTLFRNVQGISNLAQGAVDITGRLVGGSFRSQLKPASFGGVPFGVLNGTVRFGRRNAVHEYPFRDIPWVEDLGGSRTAITLTGFLVGDDVIAQRDRLIAVCTRRGDGQLVHPTLGRRTVAVLDVSASERWDQGRVFEITLSFVEQGARIYPQGLPNSLQQAATTTADVNATSATTFRARVVGALQGGAAIAANAARQASAFATLAIAQTNDATSLFKLAVSLPGEFGRLLGQARGITVGEFVGITSAVTLLDLTAQAAASRHDVQVKATAVSTAAQALGPASTDKLASAVQALAESVRAAAPTPGEAIRGLLRLAYPVALPYATGVASTAQVAAQNMVRRAAVAALHQSVAKYRATSSDDAAATRTDILTAVDREITTAGDAGDDNVYASLRAARTVITQAMGAAGANLPTLVTVVTRRPMPSLALAQRLYRDVTRADDLVARAVPPHPAFMPVSFRALNA